MTCQGVYQVEVGRIEAKVVRIGTVIGVAIRAMGICWKVITSWWLPWLIAERGLQGQAMASKGGCQARGQSAQSRCLPYGAA